MAERVCSLRCLGVIRVATLLCEGVLTLDEKKVTSTLREMSKEVQVMPIAFIFVSDAILQSLR